MSITAILYLSGMAALYVAERLLVAYDGARLTLGLIGLALLVLSLVFRARHARAASNAGVVLAHRRAFAMQCIGAASLLVYLLSTDTVVDLAGFEGEFETRWTVVFGATWPIVWLVGMLPFLAIDHAIQSSPVVMPMRRAQRALGQGLVAALGLALVFPVNFIASEHDVSWNFSYFKTAQPGTTTRALAESLEQPLDVRVFQPAASDVTPEILAYFDALKSPNLRVQVVDQASDPTLAQALRVRDNGFIAITDGTLDLEEKDVSKRPRTQLIEVGTKMRKARRVLKTLDAEVGKALITIARGELVAYVTSGHGEASWSRGIPAPKNLSGFKQLMGMQNIRLKELGLTEGLGDEVPEDAAMVIIMGPEQDFLPAEADAILRYLDRGGSLIIAVEPLPPGRAAGLGQGRVSINRILTRVGVKLGDGVLTSTQQIVAMANNKVDRLNVTTDSFSNHPSIAELADSPSRMMVSIAGYIELTENSGANVIKTVRSPASSWADLNGDLEYDSSTEKKLARTLAVAANGGKGDQQWRALALADATALADLAIIVQGNQQYLNDGVNWLTRTEAFSGRVENEEDIEIRHTKEGQTGWFYATVLGFPLLILGVGMFRTRRRQRGEA